MKLERRRYEDNAVRALRDDLAEHKRVVAVSPTGSGKTVIASLMVKRELRWRKILFLAHRHELIEQAFDTLTELGLSVGVMMAQDEKLYGKERVNPDARVQVASVQTLARRGVPKGVDLLIVDEAHRVMAETYLRIPAACPNAQVLGLTATPVRLDGQGLGSFFAKMLVVAKPSELHEGEYLAKPRVFGSTAETLGKLTEQLRGVRTSKGDFDASALSRAVDRKFLVGHVVSETLRIAPDVPKVVFACGVKHSRSLVAGFKAAGIKAAHLDGETPADERQQTLEALRKGKLEVICNVDVLSEGWDLPALGAVVIARPTKSLGRFLQMAGRALRPYKRRVPIVIDHGANVQRFDVLPGDDIEWTLDEGVRLVKGDDPKLKACVICQEFIPYGVTECPACGEEQPKTERQVREELAAQLEEITATRMAEMRKRLEVLAAQKNAPRGWVDKVMDGVRAGG